MDPGALSEAEAELVRRERGERRGGKERKERRVVAGAVGRRVLCRGSGAARAQQVSGVYQADGRIEIDAPGLQLLEDTRVAVREAGEGGAGGAGGGGDEGSAGGDGGDSGEGGGVAEPAADAAVGAKAAAAAAAAAVGVGARLSCAAFAKLAGNKSGSPYAAIVLQEARGLGTSLLEIEDPEGAAAGKYAKLLRKGAGGGGGGGSGGGGGGGGGQPQPRVPPPTTDARLSWAPMTQFDAKAKRA